MGSRLGVLVLWTVFAAQAAVTPQEVAQRLAQKARYARDSGEVVRAYLLYDEAARRDPSNANYSASRDALAPTANLLMKTQLEQPVIDADIVNAQKEAEAAAAAANPPAPGSVEVKRSLQSFPHIDAKQIKRDLDFRGDEVSLIQQVASAYGVRASWDPQLDPKPNLQMQLAQADFRTAMEALTAVTNTFVFPISSNTLYFARDSESKRNELEPVILLTVPLPNAVSDKDLIDVANAVRGVLNIRSFGWDSVNRIVFIRDRVSRALAARSLLEALLLPKAEVRFTVEILTFDKETMYHYGIAPPTSFNLVNLAPFNVAGLAGAVGRFAHLFTFGGGLSLFGMTIGDATLFASYSKAEARARYEALLVTTDGEPATLHFGQKYPIAQSLYTGFSQGSSSSSNLYQPLPQITQEDLGIEVKLTPHVTGDGQVTLHALAEFKALGAFTLNTVPSVSQRKFEGDVVLGAGQSAVLAGLDQSSLNKSRNGLPGISSIPGLNEILSENRSDRNATQTLILIRPEITRLPMSASISPQYLVGPTRGMKVLL